VRGPASGGGTTAAGEWRSRRRRTSAASRRKKTEVALQVSVANASALSLGHGWFVAASGWKTITDEAVVGPNLSASATYNRFKREWQARR